MPVWGAFGDGSCDDSGNESTDFKAKPMNQKITGNFLAALMLSPSLICSVTFAQEPAKPVATTKVDQDFIDKLQNVVKANCAANQKEDLAAAVATIHPKSPSFAATEQVTKQLFEVLDLDYTLTGFHFIGRDETYAVARVKIRTSKRGGKANFQDNTADCMITFRQDGTDWKVWSQNILEIFTN